MLQCDSPFVSTQSEQSESVNSIDGHASLQSSAQTNVILLFRFYHRSVKFAGYNIPGFYSLYCFTRIRSYENKSKD